MSTIPGDGPCAECGTVDNIVWHTEDVFWNSVVRRDGEDDHGYAETRWGVDPILCLPCFVRVAEERGYLPTGWHVSPEWPWRRDPAALGRAQLADLGEAIARANEQIRIEDAEAGAFGTAKVQLDLRANVEAVVAPWPPGVRKGDVLRAIEGE